MKTTFNIAQARSHQLNRSLWQYPKKRELEDFISANLSLEKAEHLIHVARKGEKIAKKSALPISSRLFVYWGGLFHDVAKGLSDKKLLSEADRLGIKTEKEDEKAPELLHGRVGAGIAEKDFGFTNSAVLDGPRFHTPGMSFSDNTITEEGLIVTAADKQSKDRSDDLKKTFKKIYENYGYNLLGNKVSALYVMYMKFEKKEGGVEHPYAENAINWLETELGLNNGFWKSLSVKKKKEKIIDGTALKSPYSSINFVGRNRIPSFV